MNWYVLKLKNRRVYGCCTPSGSTWFKFKNLIDGKVCEAEINLSDEALNAMISIRNEIEQASNEANKEQGSE